MRTTSRMTVVLLFALAAQAAFGRVASAQQLASRTTPAAGSSLSSHGTQLCLKALQDRKLVLLCVVDPAGGNGVGVPMAAQEFRADQRFGAASEIVLVSAGDAKEASFLRELQVDTTVPRPFTILLAPPGSVIGQFDGRASKDQLLAKLAAAQSNPCAGGTCGPGGCGPQR